MSRSPYQGGKFGFTGILFASQRPCRQFPMLTSICRQEAISYQPGTILVGTFNHEAYGLVVTVCLNVLVAVYNLRIESPILENCKTAQFTNLLCKKKSLNWATLKHIGILNEHCHVQLCGCLLTIPMRHSQQYRSQSQYIKTLRTSILRPAVGQ